MSSTERLLEITDALDEAGIRFLVMGGHAVRFYGLERQTVDFDFHVSIDSGNSLMELLKKTVMFKEAILREEPTWRREDFRRFQIGVLPSGKEEWLEFWLRNHLLPPFEDLRERRVEGWVLRRNVPFLSLEDLIRSKETERDEDWRDVAYLEEVLDERNIRLATTSESRIRSLARLRSRRGFELSMLNNWLLDQRSVDAAFQHAAHPVTIAYLLPFTTPNRRGQIPSRIDPTVVGVLNTVQPASARHFALVEAIRIGYQRHAKAQDREDKSRFRPQR